MWPQHGPTAEGGNGHWVLRRIRTAQFHICGHSANHGIDTISAHARPYARTHQPTPPRLQSHLTTHMYTCTDSHTHLYSSPHLHPPPPPPTPPYPHPHLHDHLEALRASWQEVGVVGHGGDEGALALDVGGKVRDVTKQPVHQLNVTTAERGQQRRDTTLVCRLGGGGGGGGGGSEEEEGEGE